MENEKQSKFGKVRLIVGVICLVVFCLSAFMIVTQLIQARKEAQAFEDLIDQLEQAEQAAPSRRPASSSPPGESGEPAPTEPEEPVDDVAKYQVLYEQNQDLYGWICIDGTTVNYPVMHTPQSPEYYLRRGFDKKYSLSGVPFLDGDCFTGDGNYIVYGHHMENGSMFAPIAQYAKEDFWREHPVIRFDTLEKAGEYEVMAAFYAKVYKMDDENVFRYYNYTDLTDPAVFDEFISCVDAVKLYDTGVTAEYGDQLLTLITCSYHTKNGRFVVVAREIAGDETPEPAE